MDSELYCKIGESIFGPMNPDKVKELAITGVLTREHFVRKGIDGKWLVAYKVKGLVFQEMPTAPPISVTNLQEGQPPIPPPRISESASRQNTMDQEPNTSHTYKIVKARLSAAPPPLPPPLPVELNDNSSNGLSFINIKRLCPKAVVYGVICVLLGIVLISVLIHVNLKDKDTTKFDLNSAKSYITRSRTYFDKDEYDKAIADCNEALRLEPTSVIAYNLRGVVYMNKGNIEKALTDFNETLRLNSKYQQAYYNRGLCYFKKGENNKAITDFTEAIRLDPKDAKAYGDRGSCYQDSEYALAISDYTEAIRLNPKHTFALYNRGSTYMATGKNNKAIADFTEAIRINPKFAEAYINRGIAWYTQTEYDKASIDFAEAIRLDPNNQNNAKVSLLLLASTTNKKDKSIPKARDSTLVKPENSLSEIPIVERKENDFLQNIPGVDLSTNKDERLIIKRTPRGPGLGEDIEIKRESPISDRQRFYMIELFDNGKPFYVETFKTKFGDILESTSWWSNGQMSSHDGCSISYKNNTLYGSSIEYGGTGMVEFWDTQGVLIAKIHYNKKGIPTVIRWNEAKMAAMSQVNPWYEDVVNDVRQDILEQQRKDEEWDRYKKSRPFNPYEH
jgi:tetratricopeptide (TPR) repeat protein